MEKSQLSGRFSMYGMLRKIGAIIVGISILMGFNPLSAAALDTSSGNFLAGNYYQNLINDSSFLDISSMSVVQIQAFLALKGSVLTNYSEGGKTAAQIIYDAANGAYPAAVGDWKGISVNSTTGTVSPRIILTFLEKEQSLVTRATASQDTLDCAMGYEYGQGCSNMFVNYPSLRGFANQVGNGAWQLRYDYEYAKRGTKPSDATTHFINGETTTLYNQDYTTSYPITFADSATAAIYSYTPYVFDSAYNFWLIFNNWFVETPTVTLASVDDTSSFSEKTYDTSITVGGSKNADSKVYFLGQLIQDSGTQWQLTFTANIGANDYTVLYGDGNGGVLNQKSIHVERHTTGDINGDSKVDIQDLSLMANYWGQNKPAEQLADLNGDNVVDILDLSTVASNWNG